MNYLTFSDQAGPTFPVALLLPKMERDGIQREYLNASLLLPEEVISYELYITGKKTLATDMRSWLDELLPILDDIGTKFILISDAGYFKALTGVNKADPYLGYVMPNTYPAAMAGQFQVLFIPNFRQVFYDPSRTRAKIAQALDALAAFRTGSYRDPGHSIIHFEAYPHDVEDIEAWLQKLHTYPELAVDIEGFSLKHYSAGVGTIGFAWSQHEGIAFAVDYQGSNPPKVRTLLKQFFKDYKGNLKWHHAGYDVCVKIYQLFMSHLLDVEGLLEGLSVLYDRSWDDTKIITYLATNSCAGNKLGLKEQAQEFAGNYAQDEIKDITKIPLPDLLRYNLVDCLSTWYVFHKHNATVDTDQQREVYEDLFKPALVDITQMQLHGMPVDMGKVAFARSVLEDVSQDALRRIQGETLVRAYVYELDLEHVSRRNAELKKKRIKMGDEPQAFNPNSGPQLQRLLYEEIGLPVIETTDTKAPATGAEVLEKLKAYTQDQAVRNLLDALVDFKKVEKILTAFIPALEGAVQGPDGHYYLFGNFNLGGTLSGRLSSSDPNLQNLPANVAMVISAALLQRFGDLLKPYLSKGKLLLGKLIKDCFVAAPGRLMVGLDFASLEDRISALTTKDPNKLAVYTEGFDGHCLRAQSYFAEDMPDIERAPEGAECYKALIGDKEVWFHSHETVTYLGQTMTGRELWDRLSNKQVAT